MIVRIEKLKELEIGQYKTYAWSIGKSSYSIFPDAEDYYTVVRATDTKFHIDYHGTKFTIEL